MNFQQTESVAEPFEFTSGDHVVSVNPTNVGAVRVQIALRGLALVDLDRHGEALLFLHRLNAVAHPVHPWIVCIDEDDVLTLVATMPAPDRLALAAMISEGIARARSLDNLWSAVRDGKKTSADTVQDWISTPNPLQFA